MKCETIGANVRAALRSAGCEVIRAEKYSGTTTERRVRFGRPLKLSPHQRREAIERLDAGDAVVDVARTFGVDRATLYRLRAEASPDTKHT